MPNTASAKKRVRQNVRRKAINNWRRRRIKGQTKSFLDALGGQDVKVAEAEFRKTCSMLDRISCTSTLHKNAAARRKSRLSRRLAEMKRKAKSA